MIFPIKSRIAFVRELTFIILGLNATNNHFAICTARSDLSAQWLQCKVLFGDNIFCTLTPIDFNLQSYWEKEHSTRFKTVTAKPPNKYNVIVVATFDW